MAGLITFAEGRPYRLVFSCTHKCRLQKNGIRLLLKKSALISWHLDSAFGKTVECARPRVGSPSSEFGKWGECVVRNYLVEQGVLTVRHANSVVSSFRVISDLYHPPSRTVYEVKTRTGNHEPNFRPRIWLYRKLLELAAVDKVVFFLVRYGGSSYFSIGQWREIHEAGFDTMSIVA